jgi:hypothetical protein
MQDTISRYLASLSIQSDKLLLGTLFKAIGDRLSSQLLVSGGLAIGTATTTAKIASTIYAVANGATVTKTTQDMPALVGTVTNAKFNVFVFYLDSSGTFTSAMGTEGATLAAVKFPNTPPGKAIIGFVIINPTGTGNFVGGTTTLSDATVVPNAAYVNTVGAVDPSILTS